MKTKAQKTEKVKENIENIGESKTLIFSDYKGTKVNDLNSFRKVLMELGAKFEVIKKRLLRVAFEEKKLDFDPETLEGQLGVIFTDKPVEEIAGAVYKFASGSKTFKISGGFQVGENKFLSGEEVEMIGKLPSREVLIAQVVGTIAAPIRAFLYVLNEKSKQSN